MENSYLKLKEEIRSMLFQSVQLNNFEKNQQLYYDINFKISVEDGLDLAFDIIYKECEENVAFIEPTFLENVYETFYKYSNHIIIENLKKRILNNPKKPAANFIFQQILDQK